MFGQIRLQWAVSDILNQNKVLPRLHTEILRRGQIIVAGMNIIDMLEARSWPTKALAVLIVYAATEYERALGDESVGTVALSRHCEAIMVEMNDPFIGMLFLDIRNYIGKNLSLFRGGMPPLQ